MCWSWFVRSLHISSITIIQNYLPRECDRFMSLYIITFVCCVCIGTVILNNNIMFARIAVICMAYPIKHPLYIQRGYIHIYVYYTRSRKVCPSNVHVYNLCCTEEKHILLSVENLIYNLPMEWYEIGIVPSFKSSSYRHKNLMKRFNRWNTTAKKSLLIKRGSV